MAFAVMSYELSVTVSILMGLMMSEICPPSAFLLLERIWLH